MILCIDKLLHVTLEKRLLLLQGWNLCFQTVSFYNVCLAKHCKNQFQINAIYDFNINILWFLFARPGTCHRIKRMTTCNEPQRHFRVTQIRQLEHDSPTWIHWMPQHIKPEFTFTHLTCWTWQMPILSWSTQVYIFLAMPTLFNCWWLIWHSTDTCFMCRGNMPGTTKLTNELYCNCLAAGGQDKSSIEKQMCHTWITWTRWTYDWQLCCKKGTATATHSGHMIDSCVAKKVPQLQPTLDIWLTAALQKRYRNCNPPWLFEIFFDIKMTSWDFFDIKVTFWHFFDIKVTFGDFSGCLHYCCLVDPSDFLRFFLK